MNTGFTVKHFAAQINSYWGQYHADWGQTWTLFDMFSAKTRKMVWAGSTKSVNPKSSGNLVDDVSGLIVDDMKKAGFL